MPLHKKVKRSSGLYYGCSSLFFTGAFFPHRGARVS